ncbi:hypothetical protein Barb6_01425 [Bacteroidales bacterium Barb6]|nr:hypothetical protein Barb6_01425 [Bacteroidales bacterium Barb6]
MKSTWFVLFPVLWLCLPLRGAAQTDTEEADALTMPVAKAAFKPMPSKAVLMALIPGAGQLYNRKYWKLPVVYGAFMGCAYAVSWNNRNYQDYLNAYKDVMSDDPVANGSWKNLVPGNVSEEEINSYPTDNPNFTRNIQQRKDYFRRYRDLSIIISAGVYALSILDAYVDAQLFDFDISPDLSMHIEPAFVPKTACMPQMLGVNCRILF